MNLGEKIRNIILLILLLPCILAMLILTVILDRSGSWD